MKTDTLLTLLQKKGIFIDANCGGKGRCGRCRILLKGRLKPPDEIEQLLIPGYLLKKGYRLACRYRSDKLPRALDIYLPEPKIQKGKRSKNTGMAIDIGTTIIKGAIVDLNKGRIIRKVKVYNPQQGFGGDVISRVSIANEGKYYLLRKALIAGIKDLKSKLGCENPSFTTIVGNPVMLSFYLSKSVVNFGSYPFEGEIKKGIFIKKPPGYVFGCIGGFVGGDTIAGIIASGLLKKKKPSLYIDLGTNGEIALITDRKIYVVSTAAGPAFEGVGISAGTLARPGAVERIEFSNGFKIYTIANKKPTGFCASGWIDLLSVLLKIGLLSEYGVLKREVRIKNLEINQNDIRKLQLAIGAIHTGVKFLLDINSVRPEQISVAILTGEFGSHLNSESLKTVGIIPRGIKSIKLETDLPLSGAINVLLNITDLNEVESVRKMSVHLELAAQKDFQKRFVEGLILKPWN
ncbi:MAG: ASKHA domain-containing protein [candidate division WOR-3 bacterium]